MANNVSPAPIQVANQPLDSGGNFNAVWQRWFNSVGLFINTLYTVLLQTNGVSNKVQNVLNLIADPNGTVILTPDSNGGVTITATGGSVGPPGISVRGLGFPIGQPGSGVSLTTSNTSGVLVVPFACTIQGWSLALGPGDSGTCTVKFWKIAAGTAIPTSANSINTSGVSLSTGTAVESATVSDFTTLSIAAGDLIIMAITAISGTIDNITGMLAAK